MEVDVLGESGVVAGSLGIEPVGRTGVRLALTVSGLSPGEHGVNIHARARCEPPGFFTAGGHFDPAGSRHGKADGDEVLDDPDHHAGDMLNQRAGADGTLEVVVINRSVSLIHGRNRLLDEDGASLIVYARGDDYETQPSGAAGRRVACAEIDERTGDT